MYLYDRVIMANGVTPYGTLLQSVSERQDKRAAAILHLWNGLVMGWRSGSQSRRDLGLSIVLPLVLLSMRGTILQIVNWLLPFWSSTEVGQQGQQEMAECISELFDPQGYFSDLSILQSHASAVRIVRAYAAHSHVPAHYRAGDISPLVKAVIHQPMVSPRTLHPWPPTPPSPPGVAAAMSRQAAGWLSSAMLTGGEGTQLHRSAPAPLSSPIRGSPVRQPCGDAPGARACAVPKASRAAVALPRHTTVTHGSLLTGPDAGFTAVDAVANVSRRETLSEPQSSEVRRMVVKGALPEAPDEVWRKTVVGRLHRAASLSSVGASAPAIDWIRRPGERASGGRKTGAASHSWKRIPNSALVPHESPGAPVRRRSMRTPPGGYPMRSVARPMSARERVIAAAAAR